MRGKFISFEGPDGAGKSTAMAAIVAKLAPMLSDQLVTTREPGGNQISEAIRAIILDRNNTAMTARTEALLYAAARSQHISATIEPALAKGQLVLSDRYVDSSVAYQGAGRQIGEAAVAEMNRFATQDLMPDLTVYFDVPSEVGLTRIKEHREAAQVDRLDVEKLEFHQRVRHAYLALAKENPQRIVTIDATKSPAAVVDAALVAIKTAVPEYF